MQGIRDTGPGIRDSESRGVRAQLDVTSAIVYAMLRATQLSFAQRSNPVSRIPYTLSRIPCAELCRE